VNFFCQGRVPELIPRYDPMPLSHLDHIVYVAFTKQSGNETGENSSLVRNAALFLHGFNRSKSRPTSFSFAVFMRSHRKCHHCAVANVSQFWIMTHTSDQSSFVDYGTNENMTKCNVSTTREGNMDSPYMLLRETLL
jgi:hypothetical protein